MKVLMVFLFLLAGIMADSVLKAVQKINDGTYRYAIFKVIGNEEVETVVVGNRDETYDNFLSHLEPNKCSLAIYDVSYGNGGTAQHKMVYFHWIPEGARIKEQALYNSNNFVTSALNGYKYKSINAVDYDEMNYNDVVEALKRQINKL